MVHRFDAVGACIYCGRSDIELTSEHIVPFGLGGQWELLDSSCTGCAKITGKFEGVVQRTIYGDFRMRNRLPSRRMKDRPKFRTINTEDGPKQIPVEEFPIPLWVYNFALCGILLGSAPDTDVTMSTMSTIHNHEETMAFIEKYKWDRTVTHKYMPYEFMRMIAKAGYSYAVAQMGFGNFTPIVREAILNPNTNISYFVGMNSQLEPMIENGWHTIQLSTKVAPGAKTLICANVRLFSSAGTPTYHAIVGEFESLAQETATMQESRKRGNVKLAGA